MTTPKPTPKPGQFAKPGPRPGVKPAATPAVAHGKKPEEFGRVDEDGSVFVITEDGERKIGDWQAGSIKEALAHYVSRFEDLVTEVDLMDNRLKSLPAEAAHIKEKAIELKNQLADAAVIGDLKALGERLQQLIDGADDAGERAKEEKKARRDAAVKRKEELAAEAEKIAEESTDWKAAGDRIREILEEWKTIRGIDRKTDDALWKRYSRARDSFNRRRGSHFAELDRGRAAAKRIKEELVARAEELKNSTDWNETARAFRDLMSEWKKAGRAPRDVDDKLWAAFKEAQDTFFDARNAVNDERDREFADNATKKQELLDTYAPLIDPAADLRQAREKLHELQEKWEEIGFVPRNRVREFEDKIHTLEKRVAEAEGEQWRRTDPEAQARAAQFAEKVRDFEAQAEAAVKKGKTKEAEKLREQAAQWREWAEAAKNAVDNL